MKYIKRFFKKENIQKFSIGDLVIPTIPLNDKLKEYVEKKYGTVRHAYDDVDADGLCEIIYKDVSERIIKLMDNSRVGFHREHDIENGKSDMVIWLYNNQMRHLTSEELEKYIINIDSEKYNI